MNKLKKYRITVMNFFAKFFVTIAILILFVIAIISVVLPLIADVAIIKYLI